MVIVCDKCNYRNKISKNAKQCFCNECGKKIEIVQNSNNHNGQKKFKIVIFSILIILSIGLIVFIPVRQYGKVLKVSEISKYCKTREKCELNKPMKKHLISLIKYKMKDKVEFDEIDDEYKTTIIQFGKKKVFSFTIEDDMGPVVVEKKIDLPVDIEIDLSDKITIRDFIEGDIVLNSENVKIDTSNVNIKKMGTYTIVVEAKDSYGHTNKMNIPAIVKKIKPKKITVLLNDSYMENEVISLKKSVEPDYAYDKTVKWYYLKDGFRNEIEGESVKISEPGTSYQICAESTVDSKVTSCKYITIKRKCQNEYTFTLDGGTDRSYSVSDTGSICPGKYRIYIQTLTHGATLKITYADSMLVHNFDLIDTYNPYYGGNGGVYVLNNGSSLYADPGVTSIKLTKVN